MNEKNPIDALKLHDIKDIVVIPDNSIYYFGAVVGVVVVIGLTILYFAIRYLRREKKVNLQKQYMKELKAITMDDAKKSAYAITRLGDLLEKDAPQQKAYDDLVTLLEVYKYKKEVDKTNSKVQKEFIHFKEVMGA